MAVFDWCRLSVLYVLTSTVPLRRTRSNEQHRQLLRHPPHARRHSTYPPRPHLNPLRLAIPLATKPLRPLPLNDHPPLRPNGVCKQLRRRRATILVLDNPRLAHQSHSLQTPHNPHPPHPPRRHRTPNPSPLLHPLEPDGPKTLRLP